MWLFKYHHLRYIWAGFSFWCKSPQAFSIGYLSTNQNPRKNSNEFTVGIYSAASSVTHQNLRIPVNGIEWQVSDTDGNVLPSDVFEVLESTERVRRDRKGIHKYIK